MHVTGADTIMLQSALNTGRWVTILNNKEVSARVSENFLHSQSGGGGVMFVTH